jgi:hypothetical protein
VFAPVFIVEYRDQKEPGEGTMWLVVRHTLHPFLFSVLVGSALTWTERSLSKEHVEAKSCSSMSVSIIESPIVVLWLLRLSCW